MIIRLRSRDGLERIQVDDGASLSALQQAIQGQLGVPLEQQRLSKDAALLTAKNGSGISLLSGGAASLASLGVAHGDLLFLAYDLERDVEPAYKPKPYETRPFGSHVSVADIVAKQRRIERQDKPAVEGVSFERSAADVFQQYCQSALAFSIKRGGILYGSVGEDGLVRVEFVYEPPQQGSASDLVLERGTQQEQTVDFLAGVLGLSKVGWVFSQATRDRPEGEDDYIMSSSEIQAIASIQDEMGPKAVTVLVTWVEQHVHFEAFQCSEQAVTLAKEGWFAPEEAPSGVSKMRNPKEPGVEQAIIVAGKDASQVDNDWFLCPMAITQHEGGLVTTAFPVENRLVPQNASSLRDHLRKRASLPYAARLADAHLLLWLAGQPNMERPDMQSITEAVKERGELMEGYKVIIDSIAGV